MPIRTVLIDNVSGEATYGVGGGITWDSTSEEEYEEMLSIMVWSKGKTSYEIGHLGAVISHLDLLQYRLSTPEAGVLQHIICWINNWRRELFMSEKDYHRIRGL